MNICSSCHSVKPESEFYFDKRRGKPRSQCKKCSNSDRGRKPRHYMLYNAKKRANLKGLEFDLDVKYLEQLEQKQNGRCALTGWILNWDYEYTGMQRVAPPDRASLDRIDPSRGYTRGNVQLVADAVNRMKNAYPQEVFIKMCQDVVRHHAS